MYNRTKWLDKVVDADTGELIQEGTDQSAGNFNNMENGISDNHTAAAMLLIAAGQIIAEQTGKTPILLLDDVFDKLDEGRVAELISLVSGNTFGQIVITDCSHERMERLLESSGAEYKLFDVTYGKVVE